MYCGMLACQGECPVCKLARKVRADILRGLWQLLRAYAGGGMPPQITKGIKIACQNVGMSEEHIASAELGGDDPEWLKRETVAQKCDMTGPCEDGHVCGEGKQ